MSGFYDTLCNMLIRPSRQTYSDYDLGPPAVGSLAFRQNFTFTSRQQLLIKASFYQQRAPVSQVCVIYLHSFNGSRLEPLSYVPEIIKRGFHFCSLDFAGCGNSGGEYVSLGYHERWDALNMLQEVQERWGVREFIVWGRSMGAVTAVKLHSLLQQEQSEGRLSSLRILCMVLDSAFISLKRMVIEVGQTRINMPEFLVKAVFLMVGSSIEERANFKIEELDLGPDVERLKCPVLLLASKQDSFVNHAHSEEIFSKLPLHEHKQLEYTTGEHYEQRTALTVSAILKFIQLKARMFSCQSPRQLRVSHLRQEGSLEKPSRSLRRYQPRESGGLEIAQEERIPRPFSGERGQAIKFTNAITHQFVSVGSERTIDIDDSTRLYKTEKRINNPQIKFMIGGRELQAKDGLRSKSKPTFSAKQHEVRMQRAGVSEQEPRAGSNEATQECESQSHLNIITNKLRKRGRVQKEPIEFQPRTEKTHINAIRFDPPGSPTKPDKPEPQSQPQSQPQLQLQPKSQKLSMTAQEYKNSQVKLLNGVIQLSPLGKRKLTKVRGWEQSKSMGILGGVSQGLYLRSSSKLYRLQQLQGVPPNQH